jgi:hypothetical protein
MALKGSRDNPTADKVRVMASVVREFERRMLYFLDGGGVDGGGVDGEGWRRC